VENANEPIELDLLLDGPARFAAPACIELLHGVVLW
jgi:hypothetical protein